MKITFSSFVARGLIALVVVGAWVRPVSSFAAEADDLTQALRAKIEKSDQGSVRVIVRTVPGKHAQKAAEFERRGHEKHGMFRLIEGVNLTVRVRDLEDLAGDPDVLGVSLDAPLAPHLTTATETALRKTLALPNASFSYSLGSNIGVAVIDSGIRANNDLLASRIVAFRDFTGGNGAVTASPVDGWTCGSPCRSTGATRTRGSGTSATAETVSSPTLWAPSRWVSSM